ncbi:ubiquitin carboxyl-terminal hydrolase 37-like isoform X2 [Notolabrus celidotus]|uniref:ubiquitin carboxyl-terminal hydrolase 37-like isoform X2 n=1 Tax=Notolabrus celidotus TaxID=1203425 RepID=UPI00148F620F|nr:ubiquitin carboxyl-terminal hydrolase 37-like isoform X2 [Notolabrus celidotus]
MFRICCGERTEHVVSVVVEDSRPIESSPRSGKSIDSPAVTPEKEEKTPWWYKLFGRMPSQQKKEQNVDNDQTNNTKNTKKKPKMPLWFSKRRCQVSPAQEENTPKKQCLHTLIQKKVKGLVVPKEEVDTKTEEDKKVIQDPKEAASTNIIGKHRRLEQFRNLGFPNPAQNCYMNACLQSLLTMEDFVNSINSQEQVWRSIPEAQLLRSFMEVKKSYFSQDKRMKVKLLTAFKTAVSVHAPEFRDFSQKDAHEFLTSVLEQVRSFTPKLRLMATSMGKTYKCPVESNTMFKMENTRTCKGCGAKSIREEVFTSLSLDLIPGHGTLEEMLINYLKSRIPCPPSPVEDPKLSEGRIKTMFSRGKRNRSMPLPGAAAHMRMGFTTLGNELRLRKLNIIYISSKPSAVIPPTSLITCLVDIRSWMSRNFLKLTE